MVDVPWSVVHTCGSSFLMNMETTTFTHGFFLMITRHEMFLPVDGWLMFDGLRYICVFDVTSNAWKLFSVEVPNDYGDCNEIRDSRVQPVTRFSMQHTISSLMCRRRSITFRMFLSFFFCVLRGTQRTLTGLQPLVPRYWPGY